MFALIVTPSGNAACYYRLARLVVYSISELSFTGDRSLLERYIAIRDNQISLGYISLLETMKYN